MTTHDQEEEYMMYRLADPIENRDYRARLLAVKLEASVEREVTYKSLTTADDLEKWTLIVQKAVTRVVTEQNEVLFSGRGLMLKPIFTFIENGKPITTYQVEFSDNI